MICYPHYLLASPRNIGVHTSTLEYASTADISTTPTSLKSWFSYIVVHNPIPEYVSTTSISIVMTMSFHAILFEKKVFEEVIFLLKYHQNPLRPQETEHKNKKREKNY
jgi:hypothetical protein